MDKAVIMVAPRQTGTIQWKKIISKLVKIGFLFLTSFQMFHCCEWRWNRLQLIMQNVAFCEENGKDCAFYWWLMDCIFTGCSSEWGKITIVSHLSLLEASVVLRQPETACSPGFPANALSFHGLNVDFWYSHIMRVFLGKSNVKNKYPGMVSVSHL